MAKLQSPVVIVGAGPAGCAASYVLSNKGIQHIIVEKAVFPRDKVCGDALSGKVIDVLKRIQPDLPLVMEKSGDDFTPTHGIRFVAPNAKWLDIPFPERNDQLSPGYVSKRMVFDNLLFQAINPTFAQVYQKASVKLVKQTSQKVNVEFTVGDELFEVSSSFLIAADGPQSVVRKQLGEASFNDKHHSVALRSYCTGVEGMHDQNFLELHFLKSVLPGYFWIFPLPNGAVNVGMGMLTEKVKGRKINLRETFLQILQSDESLAKRFKNAHIGEVKGWGLPLGSQNIKKVNGRVLYTGDAASLIDPFTGEGIGNAVASAEQAAKHCADALSKDNFQSSLLDVYPKWIDEHLGDELKLSHKLQKLSAIPWLFNFIVNKAYSNQKIQELMTCMFVDLDMREQLKKPSFYLRLLTGRL